MSSAAIIMHASGEGCGSVAARRTTRMVYAPQHGHAVGQCGHAALLGHVRSRRRTSSSSHSGASSASSASSASPASAARGEPSGRGEPSRHASSRRTCRGVRVRITLDHFWQSNNSLNRHSQPTLSTVNLSGSANASRSRWSMVDEPAPAPAAHRQARPDLRRRERELGDRARLGHLQRGQACEREAHTTIRPCNCMEVST